MLGRLSIRGKLMLVVTLFSVALLAITGKMLVQRHDRMWEDRIEKVRAISETTITMAQRFDAEVTAGRLDAETAKARWREAISRGAQAASSMTVDMADRSVALGEVTARAEAAGHQRRRGPARSTATWPG